MSFEKLIKPLNNIENEAKKASEIFEQTCEDVGESHNKLEQMHGDVEKLHNEEREALRKFEAIETELLEKLGDGFSGLNKKDAVKVFKISEKCPRHIISSDPLYLKMREVFEETVKPE